MKQYLLIALPLLAASLLFITGCLSKPPANLGLSEGKLSACPESPNCVSTTATDAEHAIEPITFTGTVEEAKEKILAVVNKMERTTVITIEESYIHVEYRTKIMRYVDDVEFLIVEGAEGTVRIHFRSASRVGYSDLGVNRARMEEFRRLFNE